MSTAPFTPQLQLNPIATNGALNFTWQAPADNGGSPILSYSLLCSSIPYSTTIAVTSTYCQISSLTNSQDYTFQLAATNAIGTSPYVPFYIAQPGVLPGGPRNFTISGVDPSTVNLTWTFSTNVDECVNKSFVVYVQPQESTISSYYQGIYQDQRSYQITSLQPAHYLFRLYSVNDAGWSIDNQFNAVSTVIS